MFVWIAHTLLRKYSDCFEACTHFENQWFMKRTVINNHEKIPPLTFLEMIEDLRGISWFIIQPVPVKKEITPRIFL